MTSTTSTLFLVRHAKAADRERWTGTDRSRPLVAKGQAQADRLAHTLAPERPALVASSPWLRCTQTAEPLASRVGLEVEADDRLGYDRPDLPGWVEAVLARHPGRTVVAVSHGDLIPLYLLRLGLLGGLPTFRTGSLFRVEVAGGAPARATYVDRADLREPPP